VNSSQIAAWKKQLLEGAVGLFENGRVRRPDESAANDQELYEQIGWLTMEVEWLKLKAAELS
jgi:putative transposase